MNTKLSDWALRIFVILYACVCVWLIIKECSTAKEIKNEKNIIAMIAENMIEFEDIEFCWIDEVGNDCCIDSLKDYTCSPSIPLGVENLKSILNKDYYIEKQENAALGMYRPIAMLKFNDESGNKYAVTFSFLNAEVRFYRNDIVQKVMMMYDSDHVLQIFNKF
ncbi:MAG: hypothetical protein IJX44_04530 [Bacteroidaceae bacterium]|nr:hypothetical protein [Bacteroidaceae bacterium]